MVVMKKWDFGDDKVPHNKWQTWKSKPSVLSARMCACHHRSLRNLVLASSGGASKPRRALLAASPDHPATPALLTIENGDAVRSSPSIQTMDIACLESGAEAPEFRAALEESSKRAQQVGCTVSPFQQDCTRVPVPPHPHQHLAKQEI
ncbi:uncharacterized protein LOC143655597 isoform X2 [Tamandua tetradactyla]|uniref:uncharacterized protein LOC143655597 isoform X2 n=1 Tax=Tamandua tetradactyla TaxID=48850 RepID=UPI00405424C2